LAEQRVGEYLGRIEKSWYTTASKLRKILDKLPEVEAWRETLTDYQRLDWCAPATLYKRCWIFNDKVNEKGERIAPSNPKRKKGGSSDPLAKAAEQNSALLEENALKDRRIDELESRNQELTEERDNAKRQASAEFNGGPRVNFAPDAEPSCTLDELGDLMVQVLSRRNQETINKFNLDVTERLARIFLKRSGDGDAPEPEIRPAKSKPRPAPSAVPTEPRSGPTLTWIEDLSSSREHPTFYADVSNGGYYVLWPHKTSEGMVYVVRFSLGKQAELVTLAGHKQKLSLDAAKELAERHAGESPTDKAVIKAYERWLEEKATDRRSTGMSVTCCRLSLPSWTRRPCECHRPSLRNNSFRKA
jgi:hypothetical protein